MITPQPPEFEFLQRQRQLNESGRVIASNDVTIREIVAAWVIVLIFFVLLFAVGHWHTATGPNEYSCDGSELSCSKPAIPAEQAKS